MSRKIVGSVVSNKMDKTVVVLVAKHKTHPIYKKRYKVTTKFKAHDEKNACNIGDTVEITETAKISRDKHFKVSKVISEAGA
ncbi:MAG TPA: 30S ribosomal protein S17 [Candidatus Saccharibacteria bacterium]|nr:30S ribosomal protein S17 [Candidatus Saccharibacteria bacterium]HMT39586.1 30S ribosomal protein S17 [Candidatus Saccharibacteria bacterium]